MAEGVGQARDICAGRLRDLCHGVDERDLRREKGVRGDLHEFSGREVDDESRRLSGQGARVDLVEERDRTLAVRPTRNTIDETVRRDGVLDREPLPKELGVPGQNRVNGRRPHQQVEPRGSADRHRRLAHDEVARA